MLLSLSTLASALSDGIVLTKLFQFSKAPSVSAFATVLGGVAAWPFARGCPCPAEAGAENAGAPMSYNAHCTASQHTDAHLEKLAPRSLRIRYSCL